MSTANKSLKILFFTVGSLHLAFNIDVVIKINKYTSVLGSGLTHYGITNLGDREITVIDLHKRLFNSSQPRSSQTGGYLLLAKNSVEETFGIVLGQTPTLLDVSLSQIRVLPESYRQSDTLQIATHVILFTQAEEKLTVFLLDPDELLPVTLNRVC
ncbi:MAG: chemotaxis protein CheW [Gloeocapsa sp. DLM2.Bin57]|nr:MAG: chemotaxis protein CheW [Gloeocapsa sp. DLM2.Bin57]